MNIGIFANTSAQQLYESGYPRIESQKGTPQSPLFEDPYGNDKEHEDEAPGLVDDQIERSITVETDGISDKFNLDFNFQHNQISSYTNDFVAIIFTKVNDYVRDVSDNIITLAATLAAGATNLTLSGTPSPELAANDIIKIQSEAVKISSGSAGSYVVVRAQYGTTDANHNSTGVPVMHLNTQVNIRNNAAEDQDATLTKSKSGYFGEYGTTYDDDIASDISRILVSEDPLNQHLPAWTKKFVLIEASDLTGWIVLQPELDVINSGWTWDFGISQALIGTMLNLTNVIRGYPIDLKPNTKGLATRRSLGGQSYTTELFRPLRRWSFKFVLTQAEKDQVIFTLGVLRKSPFIITMDYEADDPTYFWVRMTKEDKFTPMINKAYRDSGNYWNWGFEIEEAL